LRSGRAHEQQLWKALAPLEVGHALKQVGVLAMSAALVPYPPGGAQRVRMVAPHEPLVERPAGGYSM
jgi:hypothetical protein